MSGVIRTSVSSRRLCRTISCPAACGIKCVNPSSATMSPSETSSRTASPRVTTSAIALERERVSRPRLHRHPPQLGELVDHGLTAEPPPAGVLDAAERHLGLVADRLVVDVHDPRLELLREREAALGIHRQDPGAQAVA